MKFRYLNKLERLSFFVTTRWTYAAMVECRSLLCGNWNWGIRE